MKHRILILALLCAVAQGAWAQNGIYCTASDKNRVVCTDGTIYDNVADATTAGKTAAAKIIYIDEVNKKGLALALKDEAKNTQDGGITACNNKNTSMPVVGGTWKLASKSEWDSMISAAGGSPALHNGFSSVGGTNMDFDVYWSSEKNGSNGLLLQYSRGWSDFVSNSQYANIRACLTFNLLTLYEIGSQSEWNEFCTAVNAGNNFIDKYVKLTSDISVTQKCGTVSGTTLTNAFSGTFDGDGHTITAAITDTGNQGTALFCYINGATIMNLKVAGTITGGMHAAAIVGTSEGTGRSATEETLGSSKNVIEGCVATANVSGGTHIGGILGHGTTSDIAIRGCVFSGTMTGGGEAKGALFGWGDNGGAKSVTDCLYVMANGQDTGGLDLVRQWDGTVNIDNCYFVATANLPTNQGTQVYYTAPANEISKSITISGTTVYSDACSVSGVEATYNLDSGLASVTPTLTDPSAATLTFGTDYTATLNGNAVQNLPVKISTAGSYTLVLTGAGSYTGTKTFNITATGDPVNSALIISSEAEWDTFAESVNNGTNYYNNQFVKLTADIRVSTMVGTSEIPFNGTFLGNGHTITANITDTGNSGTALFRYINGATIQDLTVGGTITGGLHAAAIVGFAQGTGNSIRNCVATANVSGGTHIGGILGHGTTSDIAISGCVFSGTMTGGAYVKGAIVGWGDNGGTKSVTDCLYLMANGQNTLGLDLVRMNEGTVSVENSYKTTSAGTYGTQCICTNDTPSSLGTLKQDYGMVKAYATGILYDGTYYMAPATLAGSGTEGDPYLIRSTYEWDSFARHVNEGNTYSGQYVKLTSDISVSTMVGTSEANSFQGTFLGDGTHALTFTKGSSSAAFDEENCAPFRYIKNATIRDLKVMGDIYTSQKFAGGLVACCIGTTNIIGCQVGTLIYSSVSGDGTHGGIVAMPQSGSTLNIEGCVYDGHLLTNSGTQYCGGFVGWHNGATISVSNSLYAPASSSIPTGWTAITSGTTFVRGGNPTITGCCYTETMGNAQGTQCFPAAVEPTALGELVKEYGVLKVYQNGIFYDGIYYMVPVSISLADAGDNSTTISEAHGYVADVTLTDRTLYKDGKWNTICLPFDVTLAGSALNGATARPLTAASISGTTLNLTFGDAVNTLEAGTPYIIKWDGDGTSNIENPVFEGVTIETTKHDYDTNKESVTTDERVRFVGTYKSTAFDAEDQSILLMGAANTLYYPTTGAGIGAQRAYFKIGGEGALQARRLTSFSIDFGDGEATGIISVHDSGFTVNGSDVWYTLDGRRLNGKPTRAGVYINKGKKVAIK